MNHVEMRMKRGILEYRCREPQVDANGAFCGWSDIWNDWEAVVTNAHDSATGRAGNGEGDSTLRFEGGPFDGQEWEFVDCHDFGPTADNGCIVIRDDHPNGWPLYESDAGTFGDADVVVKFKGWD